MQTVEFESLVEEGSIRIPDEFLRYLTGVVRVTIVPVRSGKIKHARRPGPGMVTLNDFATPVIDTRGWRFNREEANERR